MKRILIITAMESETLPICKKLCLKQMVCTFGSPATFVTYQGSILDTEIILAWNGSDAVYGVDSIGTQPSTLTAFLCIKEFSPDIVLSVGTAGGFTSQGTKVNDIFISKTPVIYHGRRIDVDHFTAYGIGYYPSISAENIAHLLGVKVGVISTGDSFAHDDAERQYIRNLGGNAVEMEAAAIAWVCSLYKIPFLALKVIVNLVDGPQPPHEEFISNLSVGCEQLQNVTAKLTMLLASSDIERAEGAFNLCLRRAES